MSDYQVTNYGKCGECKWHRPRFSKNELGKEFYQGWYCDNEQSDYYTDYTDYTDACECFEQRGVE